MQNKFALDIAERQPLNAIEFLEVFCLKKNVEVTLEPQLDASSYRPTTCVSYVVTDILYFRGRFSITKNIV